MLLALVSSFPAFAQTGGAVYGLFGYASMTTGTTGGAGGTSVTVSTGTALQAAISKPLLGTRARSRSPFTSTALSRWPTRQR
ncbi:hypothetical protein [Hymenobacter siberiensis]|jgi:pectate lyase|uniref:hypothetical protein n=1 Tax=Hymenobacter siberiensis TaxID=2848396 RepID=UPI001C1E05E4|nr:hypothetical protein [Hymenobacter siberiensis]